MHPPVPIDDMTLVRLYRRESGDDEVSQAIAELGADVAIRDMRRKHRAHSVALQLHPRDLHQRAELLELLYQEFDIPEPGANRAIETDADRGRYFRQVVLRLLEREVEAKVHADEQAAMWVDEDDLPDDWER